MSQTEHDDSRLHSTLSGAAVVTSVKMIEKLDETNEAENADLRQDEIVLDHALAKSSNVASPIDTNLPQSSPDISSYKPSIISPSPTPLPLLEGNSNDHSLNIEDDITATGTKSDKAQTLSTKNTLDASKSTTSEAVKPIKQIDEKAETKRNNKIPEGAEVISLEDDFFSFNYVPSYVPDKKKKKKKLKKKRENSVRASSATASSPIVLDSDPPEVSKFKEDSEDLVIIEDGNDENSNILKQPTKKRKITRALTPPPIDEAEIRKKFLSQSGSSVGLTGYENDAPLFLDDPSDDFKFRLAQLGRFTQSVAAGTQSIKRSSTSNTDLEEETTGRDYILNVVSYLPGTADHEMELNVKGNKRISAIMKKSLQYLLDLGIIEEHYHPIYKPEAVKLYWKNIQLHDYMKIDSLNIPVPLSGKPSHVELKMYTNAQSNELEFAKKREEQERLAKRAKEEALDNLLKNNVESEVVFDPFKDAEEFKEVDEELSNETPPTQSIENKTTEDVNDIAGAGDGGEGYFNIGLKGEDNKKVEVSVNPETLIKNLVQYYLKTKGLPEDTKVRFSFDDEDIDLDGTVGDTELEEDFTIEVYILK